MIYPCPYCETKLNLYPEHIGKTISCPACNRAFVANDTSPVTIATPEQIKAESPTSFKSIFNIVLKVFLAIFLLGLIIAVVLGVIGIIHGMTSTTIEDKIRGAEKVLESSTPQSEADRKSAETLRELDAEAGF